MNNFWYCRRIKTTLLTHPMWLRVQRLLWHQDLPVNF